ncbi:tRNA(Ile)-lysidine synthase [Tetragenococcus halophilus subsp. halophilus]|uniref:tRNA lysidine(34) synthetase TilS n=1 Tax=Tetragenococcus halophilus TaxID=51669 RepID=UPI000CBFE32F|nr:tRNA lysidine(34) synthetase TilS [Tetragenococcus halophilus]GBD79281.1 tRNA(Ile)-lysidine synthase [Tetragenococcus halophilus subsp. halophilus]GBD81796.1 tRNA(Ile)-lysidine synthase [Tetragenococcus halophilus subsp. halophilus]GFK20749.1 tRNA(Ile)-lysidine synthetase [Tetragenococcus halophilus]
MLLSQVESFIEENQLLKANERILVAVSTGVDSMVLLHILERLQKKSDFTIGVAHVNHKLRKASDEEESFLRTYCQKHQLLFYTTSWKHSPTSGMEEKARAFRYNFFREIMDDYHYQVLATAHHSDDQMETMIMKMVRDGNLFSAKGILANQSFGKSQALIRPLLHISKEEILNYSQQEGIDYFEDQTNTSFDMQRNRIRHQVIPLLKKENKQTLQHFQRLSCQIEAAQEVITDQQKQWYQTITTENHNEFEINLHAYLKFSTAQQSFFWQELAKKARQYYNLTISAKQIEQLMKLLAREKANWEIDIDQTWQFQKSYGQLFLRKSQTVFDKDASYMLSVGESLFLSENEWLGFFPKDEVKIPEKVKFWLEYRQNLTLEFPTRVQLRRRQAGDRIQLNEQLNKKLSRFFIDKKVSPVSREKAWVITDFEGKVLGVLPHVFSYLCITKETAKIHYVLLYRYQKPKLEGEANAGKRY